MILIFFTLSAVFAPSIALLKPRLNIDELDAKPNYSIPQLNFNRTAIDEYVQSILSCKSDQIGSISLAIAQLNETDQIVQSIATGYGRTILTETNSPTADGHTRFCIASITKQFTSQVVGKVLELNKKTFDITLKRILPKSYKFYSDSLLSSDPDLAELLTIRDLLSHRSDIPRYDNAWLMGLSKPREEIWKNLYQLEPAGILSTKWRSSFEYNNWMVTLAAYAATIMHDPSGKTTWEDLIREFFFKPLQLDSAVFMHDDHGWKNFSLPAIRYLNGSGWSEMDLDYVQKTIATISPAGSICLSAVDMVKYIQHLTRFSESPGNTSSRATLYQTFLPSNYIRQQQFTPIDPMDIKSTTDGYGLGWFLGTTNGVRTISHPGDAFGYHSSLALAPDYKTGIYVSTTNDPWYSYSHAAAISGGIFDILMNRSVSTQYGSESICKMQLPTLTSNSIDSLNCTVEYGTDIAKVLGVYKNPTFDDITVDYMPKTKQLRLYFGSQGSMTLCYGELSMPDTFGIFATKLDFNSTLAVFNYDQFFNISTSYVFFNINNFSKQVELFAFFIEAEGPTYVKSLTTASTAATPKSSSVKTSTAKTITSTSKGVRFVHGYVLKLVQVLLISYLCAQCIAV